MQPNTQSSSGALSTRATTSLGGTSAGTLKAKAQHIDEVYSSPIAQLTVTITGKSSQVFPISRAKTIIGRLGTACDIILDDGIVSSRHLAVYIYANRMVFAEDLGSTNGSFLLTDPPLALDPLTRLQWSDGSRASQFSIGLGGTGKVALSISTVQFPTPSEAQAANVPPTLLEGVDDDDDALPPPALINFERRKSNLSDTEDRSSSAAPVAATATVLAASPPPQVPAQVIDVDATLDYKNILLNSPTVSNASPAQQLSNHSSGSLIGFCASPAMPAPAPQLAVQPTSTASSLGIDTKLSPTPPAGIPNTLASTASVHTNLDDDDDESPPPPTSAIRRRIASQNEGVDAGSPHSDATTATVQATLDVGALSPAKRALVYDETQDETTIAAPAPVQGASVGNEEAVKKRQRDTEDDEALSAIPPPPAVARRTAREISVEQQPGDDASAVKKRQREAEEAEDGAPIVDRIESSPTQASLVSSSEAPKKRGGARQEVPLPVTMVEGGAIVLPLSPQASVAEVPVAAAPTPAVRAPPVEPSPPPAAASPPKRRAPPVSSEPAAQTVAVVVPPPPPPPVAAKWQFKVDLRKGANRDEAWEDYPAADSGTIEAAFLLYDAATTGTKKKPKKTLIEVKLNSTYGVHFEDMVQFRFDDRSRQRPIRRKL